MELSLASICLFNEYRPSHLLRNGQQKKIKKRLKLLNHYMCHYSLIKLQWIDFDHFKGILLVFSHGVISSICMDSNHSLISVSHDNFLMNKLTTKRISSFAINEKFILISYYEPHLALIALEDNFKPNQIHHKFKLKNNCQVRQINLDKYVRGFAKRNLSVGDQYALIWWNHIPHRHSWTSTTLNQEKNLLIFNFDDCSVIDTADPINGEILQVDFVAKEPSKFGILHKQKSSAYNLTYLLFALTSDADSTSVENSSCLDLVFEINIPLEKLCFSAEFTKSQDKILLLCDDESVMLFNIEQNVLYSLHSSKPVCFISSYPLDSIFVTCDQNGHLSFYDTAFNNLSHGNQPETIENEKPNKSTCNDSNMSVKRLQFLSPNILITHMVQNRHEESAKIKKQTQKQDSGCVGIKHNLLPSLRTTTATQCNNSCCLKLTFFPHRISTKRLINEYLYLSKYEEALNMLRVINWNCSYEDAYLCLHTIFEYLMKLPANIHIDEHIESTLAAFLVPMTPIDFKIFERILPYIRQLAIRFFYHLTRNDSLQKAYQLSIELKSPRLFLLLSQLFKLKGQEDFAIKSYEQAQSLL